MFSYTLILIQLLPLRVKRFFFIQNINCRLMFLRNVILSNLGLPEFQVQGLFKIFLA